MMEKSPEFLKVNENSKDQVIFLLMVFAGVFVSAYLSQGNLEWSIADGLVSTISVGLGAILIKLMLNYYPVGVVKSWPTLLFSLVLAAVLTYGNQMLWGSGWLGFAENLILFKVTVPLRISIGTWLFHLVGMNVLSNRSSTKDIHKLQHEESRQKLSTDAELHYLRQQMQPHFLFNSLNSINALLKRDPEKARNMVQGLADFYRKNLKADSKKWTVVATEIEAITQYFYLEKIRFGQRLNYEIDIPESILTLKLPSLLLQTLVENAVKHGLYGVTGEVSIQIEGKLKEGNLEITVRNPSEENSKKATGTGFGLESLDRRLFLIFGRKDLLSYSQSEGQFTAILKIPQIK
ncbi:hypothetical protein GCM10027284_12700 [Cyclobacterium sediminis]